MEWDEKAALKFDALRKGQSSAISYIYPALEKRGFFKKEARVLSIGGGRGEIEVALMRDYGIKLDFVDPAHHFVNFFKASVTENQLNDNLIEVFEGPFQRFETACRYDLVLSVHAWHYFGFDESILKKALKPLKPEGKLCLVLTSETAFSKELKDLVHPNHGFINYEAFSSWAEGLGYSNQSDYVSKLRPLSHYLDGNEFTKYSKNLMCFLSRKPWDDISEDTKKAVLSLFIKYAKNGVLDDGWGIVVFCSK